MISVAVFFACIALMCAAGAVYGIRTGGDE